MTYEETLEYLFRQLPMYQREGKSAFKKDLKNINKICSLLHSPQSEFKSIHIAGTNGKGSTAHMLSSVFQEAGYKTGLYTSPHLKDFRERVKINGRMISKEEVIDFVKLNQTLFESIQPSFFEWTVALAFDYFRNQKVDIAIIETGLGGRLDSTNILSPIMSIITNISFDHMDMLGNTLDKIAYEKAGIIKKNIPVIIGNHSNQKEVFLKKAASCNSNISFANEEISSSSLETDLLGDYQCENLVTVECAINKLRTLGWKLNPESINNGLLAVAKNTHLQGRWQILSEKPKIILETAHNKEGLIAALTQLKSLKYRQLHLVIGFVKDKDIDEILALFPKHATYYFCQAKIPRSLDVTDLKNKAAHHELRGNAFLTVELALKAAKENTLSTDIIYVGGSNFIVAEAL